MQADRQYNRYEVPTIIVEPTRPILQAAAIRSYLLLICLHSASSDPGHLTPGRCGRTMEAIAIRMDCASTHQPSQTILQSPIRGCEGYGPPESPSAYMMDLDLDENLTTEGEARYGCLILCCAECSGTVLIEYSNGSIPGLPRFSSTSPRRNGVALTDCRTCFARTKKGLEGRAHDNRGQFRMARSPSMRLDPWDISDLTQAATLVFKETVSLMLIGRVCLHLSWDRVSRTITSKDRVTSLDTSQAVTGDAQKVILSHLAGNWI
jgi:hypothetical protein